MDALLIEGFSVGTWEVNDDHYSITLSILVVTVTFIAIFFYISGHDIHEVNKYLPGRVVALNISRISFTPGKIYYCNVIGYSHSGIHKTQPSDGIMTDSVPPVPGTIYDGIGNICPNISCILLLHIKYIC